VPETRKRGPTKAVHEETCAAFGAGSKKGCTCGATAQARMRQEQQQPPQPTLSIGSERGPAPAGAVPSKQWIPALLRAEEGASPPLPQSVLNTMRSSMAGVQINGTTKEIYINAGSWPAGELHIPLALKNAGHKNDMQLQWSKATRHNDELHASMLQLVNNASRRAVEHLKTIGALGDEHEAHVNAPSLLLNGDGGMPHADAEREWSFLLALARGIPTKVFKGGDGVKAAFDLLGITEAELSLSHGCDFVRNYAPLLLPRSQLEKLMVPVGGVGTTLEPGDMVVLPPKQVHETPKTVGTESRAMFFFTIVLQSPKASVAPTQLYDPLHQYLPFDVLGRIVTHNLFPERITECIDLLFESHLQWATHDKYCYNQKKMTDTARRLEDQTPTDNAAATKRLVEAIKKMLQARLEGQNTRWATATLVE